MTYKEERADNEKSEQVLRGVVDLGVGAVEAIDSECHVGLKSR